MVVFFSKALIEKQELRRADVKDMKGLASIGKPNTVVEQDDRDFESVSGTDETPFIIV